MTAGLRGRYNRAIRLESGHLLRRQTKMNRSAVLASHLLLMVVPLAVGVPGLAQGTKAPGANPDLAEVRQLRLTMDRIDKLVAATGALNKMIAADPSLKKRMDAHADDDQTIDQKVHNIDANFPQAAAVLHANGFTTREYIVTSLAFLNDLLLVAMKKDGMIKELPANAVTPENAAFIEQNYDKLKVIGDKLKPPDSDTQ
jgi:hypothetical protein